MVRLSRLVPAFSHILTAVIFNICARGSGIKSVSVDDSLLGLLGLKPTTRSTASLCESVSTLETDEFICYSTFLTGGYRGCWHSIESYNNMPMCALIIATFSAFLPLKVILWWEKYKKSSSTLKEASLSELYSPTQSMPLYSRFSPFHSLPFSLLFLLLLAHFYLGKVLSILCYKGFGDNVFIWKLSNSLTTSLTSLLSSNNRLNWARGWKSSSSWPLVGVALQER